MSKTNDGGPAFPRSDAGYSPTQDGMSLRDWFAGQALVGLMQADMSEEEYEVSPSLLALTAYRMADAMIAARSPSSEG